MLALRGDFFGRAITEYRPLSDRVQGAQVNLAPMKRDELRLAIEELTRKVGLTLEAGLVDLILEQVSDEPGHLPLVEFVLQRLWEDRQAASFIMRPTRQWVSCRELSRRRQSPYSRS